MFAHAFELVKHFKIGPMRNQLGYIFAVAEIADLWILRWQDPRGLQHVRMYADHDQVVASIERLNRGLRVD
jgi:hypothetical protein